MQSKVSPPIDTMHTKEACHGEHYTSSRDGSTTDITESPWDPSWIFIAHQSHHHKNVDWKKMDEVWIGHYHTNLYVYDLASVLFP